jgi:triosephosphate isomerase
MAIGTGKSASGDDANQTIGFIRQFISHLHGNGIANTVRILYGGSVTAANVGELMRKSDIDGALVGGASLKADDFVSIVSRLPILKAFSRSMKRLIAIVGPTGIGKSRLAYIWPRFFT